MLRESASLRESEGGAIPVRVDRKRTVRLLHTQEEAVDVRAMDLIVRADDREGVDGGVGHHGVGILGKSKDRKVLRDGCPRSRPKRTDRLRWS